MADAMAAAAFQNVGKAHYIAVDISPWVLQRVAHAGLSGEIDHGVKAVLFKKRFQSREITQVCSGEGEASPVFDLRQPGQFQVDVVVVVQVVQPDDAISPCQQLSGNV